MLVSRWAAPHRHIKDGDFGCPKNKKKVLHSLGKKRLVLVLFVRVNVLLVTKQGFRYAFAVAYSCSKRADWQRWGCPSCHKKGQWQQHLRGNCATSHHLCFTFDKAHEICSSCVSQRSFAYFLPFSFTAVPIHACITCVEEQGIELRVKWPHWAISWT